MNIVQNVTLREALGIFASGFVLLSMTVKSDRKCPDDPVWILDWVF